YEFDKVGAFKYSREEGTFASTIEPQISENVKQKRYNRLMKLQRAISKRKNQKLKEQVIKVLVEGYDHENNLYIGRSQKDAPFVDGVIKFSGNDCNLGQIYPVKIVESLEYDLLGELKNES
ncbi:MAG: 30S ribosomal protein S12 methylthiotransferase RimO, partial [Tepidanaerobacteraceae bacterium]|nr:30S ribosomal protein S12 methylthiotransferase RimO [Tepidanaerobacteraceae bacterium]